MDADFRHRVARVALIAAATLGFAATGRAQEVPEGQSCGGLVCDLGLFGHKTAAKPAAVPSPAVATPPPAPTRAAARSEPAAEAKTPTRKKAHVARVSAAKPARAATPTAFGAPPVTSALVPVFAAPVAAPTPVAAAPVALPPAFAASPSPPPVPITATPARDEPVVLSNPYVYNKPLKFMFQSVDPTQGVQ